MRHLRFTIAGLMGAVLIAAVGLSAMRNASATWAGVMFLVTYGVLGLAIVGAICRGSPDRAWWIGFFVFGWGYLSLVAYWSTWFPFDPYQLDAFPTSMALSAIRPRFGPAIEAGGQTREGLIANQCYSRIGHDLLALLAALLGGILARVLFGNPAACSEGRATDARATGPPPRKWWRMLTIAALAGLVLACSFVAIRSRSDAGFWSGATYLLTWGLLGLSALGAIVDRGRRRIAWLGATLLGGGYMYMAFARKPDRPIPSDQFIDAVRWWSPRFDRNNGSANARILEALEQPIPMRFLSETPLEDVLAYIKRATSTPTYPGIPICIEPTELKVTDRSFNGPVQIDLEGVPLKSTLRLCLKELGCAYSVRDGYLRIAPEEDISTEPQDPGRVVGHCLLALIAAGFGSLASLLVSAARIPSAERE
jgi:hypothetical protein